MNTYESQLNNKCEIDQFLLFFISDIFNVWICGMKIDFGWTGFVKFILKDSELNVKCLVFG